jgi:hypothetical protein
MVGGSRPDPPSRHTSAPEQRIGARVHIGGRSPLESGTWLTRTVRQASGLKQLDPSSPSSARQPYWSSLCCFSRFGLIAKPFVPTRWATIRSRPTHRLQSRVACGRLAANTALEGGRGRSVLRARPSRRCCASPADREHIYANAAGWVIAPHLSRQLTSKDEGSCRRGRAPRVAGQHQVG